MEELGEEYEDWCRRNGLGEHYDKGCGVDELFLIDGTEGGKLLTEEQRTWLKEFEARWDRQQAIIDRLQIIRDTQMAIVL